MIIVGELPTCAEVVELASDYLDGNMPDADRACLEQHLLLCDACDTYVDQLRITIRGAGTLAEGDEVDSEAMAALMALFRSRSEP
jgi:anti-sigma factor RsiW